MLRKVIYTIIVSLLILGITGCNDGKPDPTGDNPTVSYTTSITDTTPSFTEVSLPEQIPPTTIQTEPTHAASRQITWELGFYGAPNSDGQKEINRLLLEKGYDCEIRFVPTGAYDTDMIRPWLEDYEANNPPLDILFTGSFSDDYFEAIDFVREKYISLSDYLESEKGRPLKEVFSPFEWSHTTIEGNIYAIPPMISPIASTPFVYLYVPDRYIELFSDFDGSYSMLMDIYSAHHTADEVIVLGEMSTLESLLPYKRFLRTVPYDVKEQSFVDISMNPEDIELIKRIAGDFHTGKLVVPTLSQVADENMFVLLQYVRIEKEGFTAMPLNGYAGYINMNMSYGVSQKSENQDLALEILSVCYTDPEIAAYLLPEMESEEAIAKRRAFLSQVEPGDIQDFFPELSKSQQETMIRYSTAYRNLFN
ncbi:MAG: hypothetical protein J5757_01515, partial [Lachnospiraceae bacterium]|nr:hypothetical protein [Lachnospiraceae bacterium]